MIELRNVTVKNGRFVLSEISCEIPDERYGVLMGKMGAGKTTLLGYFGTGSTYGLNCFNSREDSPQTRRKLRRRKLEPAKGAIMRKIAVQLYSLRERAQQDYFGVLKDVAEMGYAGVEPAGLYGHSPAEVKKVCDDLGLVVCSAHAGLPDKDNINEVEDTAKTLGYQYLVSGFGPDDFKTMDAIKTSAAKFQAGAELAKERGLRVGYHNHYWEFDLVEGRYGYSRFFELAPGVFSQLDTYWACNFNVVDVPLVTACYQDNLPLLHIKDGPLVKGEPHTAVGQGKMNFPEILAAAGDTTEWLIVELDACATDMTQAVRESYQYLAGCKLGQGRK